MLRTVLDRLGLLGPARRLRRALLDLTPRARRHRRLRAEHRRRTAELYGRFVGPGDLCFDVGANLGERAAVLRSLGARVVAVEPNPACLDVLRRRFADDPHVVVVAKGAGAEDGRARLLVSSDIQTSSMSREWVEAVRHRLPGYSWDEAREVEITTLDRLIAAHGEPAFCKVDVEGFELEVLRGLSRPLRALSFEYTPERLQPALGCLERLRALGDYVFNLADEGSMALDLDAWATAEEMAEHLRGLAGSRRSGDVYARLRP